MLKRSLIFLLVLTFGINIVSAQQQDTESCDPYRLGESSFSINSGDLTAPAEDEIEAFAMQEIGINPDVLMSLADNMNGSPTKPAAFANPATRLAPSYFAFVTRDDVPLAVYEGVCTESQVLARLHEGTRVTVLDGPIAADGFAWWRVRRSDLTGWVIEGAGSEIWLTGAR